MTIGAFAKPNAKATLEYDAAKADVWAMGVMLCVMLIGKFPFDGDSVSTRDIDGDPLRAVFRQQTQKARG